MAAAWTQRGSPGDSFLSRAEDHGEFTGPEVPPISQNFERGYSAGASAGVRVADGDELNSSLLLEAFSSMSLHDRCALTLGLCRDLTSMHKYLEDDPNNARQRGEEYLSPEMQRERAASELDADVSSEVASVITDADLSDSLNLDVAMAMMGQEELSSLEDEASTIQHSVRAWLVRRHYQSMRDATRILQGSMRRHVLSKSVKAAAGKMADEREKSGEDTLMELDNPESRLENAMVTLHARKNYKQTRQDVITAQAATRAMLARRNFRRIKGQMVASLVIANNIYRWRSRREELTRGEKALSADQLPQDKDMT